MAKTKSVLGAWGRVAFIDLSRGHAWIEKPGSEIYEKYLGGIGLSAKFLWELVRPGSDPLGEDNVLCFTPGVLTDTGALFSGRFTVAAKSPASNSWGDANCGGYFAPALKRCEIDGLVILGQSDIPAYLVINEKEIRIEDATSLWGRDTIETEAILKEKHGKPSQVACIGPGGEKKSLMAGIFTDRGRAAARGGLGAVMGAKNLKAIVASGSSKVAVWDRDEVLRLSREFSNRLKKLRRLQPYLNDRTLGLMGSLTRGGYAYMRQPADLWRLLLSKFGTCSLNALSAESGDSPVKNWTGIGHFDFPLNLSQRIGAQSVIRHQKKRYGCASCPTRCGGIMSPPEDWGIQGETHKPEYETCCAFGALLLNNDLKSIFQINDMLNRAGLDTISCGATVAFAVECFENGLIDTSDTDGLELRWGDSRSILELVKKIIQRDGIGEILADGVRLGAEKIGKEAGKYAVHCGGVEAPMHDPKFDPGFLASYSLLSAPGRHTAVSYQYLELQGLEKTFSRPPKIPMITSRKTRFRYDQKKVEGLAIDAFFKMLIDCAGLCLFGTQVGGQMPIVPWLNAATGRDLSPEEYLTIGERVFQLRHLFNIREGINPAKDFKPHPRLLGEVPFKKGPARGVTLSFDQLARAFYECMNWDMNTAEPKKDYLESLGLGDLITSPSLAQRAKR
ncbi:MAG: aldehyde ferredoxin oxidoreductase [Deltaproteobacteria bacterium]|nr:MAG: aldehyde ferredoxin oxidoreductase [Deltaproteobacteria bacterium]